MFQQLTLPYAYDAFEPYIDAATMELHYNKHHAGYTQKLNDVAAGHPEFFADKTIERLLSHLSDAPEEIRTILRNQGGGFYNHNLYFEQFSAASPPLSGKLAAAIERQFGSFEDFQAQFTEAAIGRFGSGWAWLVVDDSDNLAICSTANQDSPLMPESGASGTPLLALDLWEHAYYLRYQNRRPDYIDAWWHLVDWGVVAKRLPF